MADTETANLVSVITDDVFSDNNSQYGAGVSDGNGKNGIGSTVREFADLISTLRDPLQAGQVFVNEYTGDVEDEERGRRLFFKDGKKRIDYILVWSHKDGVRHADEKQMARKTFEENLRREGLSLEEDVEMYRAEQYTKIHAPLEVLKRYAETMKIRMPIKERPEEIPDLGIWDKLSGYATCFLKPFELNTLKVPSLRKRFTHVFERDKRYLFCIPDNEEHFFSHATRSRIVDYILRRKEYKEDGQHVFSFGIKRLLSDRTYLAAYPLHEGSWKPNSKPNIRKMLYDNWAMWRVFYKIQPLQYIRVYFGEKIGLYFAWLGYYTYSLILPSFVGLLVFLYGILTVKSDPISNESCDPNNTFVMCPMCYLRCNYWSLNQLCLHNRATHMFDNGATVFFAMFMSVWSVFFLEFWKREQAGIQFLWDMKNFEQEEEPPRPEYLDRLAQSPYHRKNKITGAEEPFHPFWRRKVPVFLSSISLMLTMVLIAIAAIIGVVFYRISVLAALYAIDDPIVYQNANLIVTATAALINLVIILILNFFYSKLAMVLTDWECLRTQSEYDNSVTLKFYIFQFVNYYSSLFYIAFFKGRFVGSPANPVTFISARQEECQGSCLTELCIQLAIIFVGKQLIQNNLMEIYLPRIKRWVKKKCGKVDENLKLDVKPWVKDYTLEELGPMGLFNEYLEMMIQFGFVTLFVAAFPLAPFCALLNNIIELRADANKFVTQYRREMAAPAATIGIWYSILCGLSRFAIVTNALIIAFTSNFIHRELYKAVYSPTGSLEGFVNHSLSYFDVNNFTVKPDITGRFNDTKYCRYSDYREPPWSENKYKYTTRYWHVVAVQFIFVVVFENIVIFLVGMIAYLIPDVPGKLKEQLRREAVVTNEVILETELKRARGGQDVTLSDSEMENIRKRAINVLDEFAVADDRDMLEMAARRMAHEDP